MIRSKKIRWYICKFCGSKVAMENGANIVTLISHLRVHHPDKLDEHKKEHLDIIVDNCYYLKGNKN